MKAPRRHVHRGTVEAVGFHLDASLAPDARARILSYWTGRARVLEAPDGFVLVLAEPVSIAVELAPGAPLVRTGPVSATCPLEPDELEALRARPGSFVVLRGGTPVTIDAHAAKGVDPAAWLDVGPIEHVEVSSLGAPPTPPPLAVPPIAVDVRRALAVPAATVALDEVRAALREAGTAAASRTSAPARRAAPRLPPEVDAAQDRSSGALDALFGLLGAWLGALARALGNLSSGTGGGADAGPGTGALVVEPERAPRGPSPVERLRARLTETAARMMRRTRLDRFIGRRQGEYIASMMDLFERGRLDEAIRRAIPLADVATARPKATALPAVLSPRTDLRITSGAGPGRAIHVVDELHQALELMYRRAFAQLDREGRHDEAAFVLAELLRSSEEAVDYLERRGRLELAAQVAEARGLPPGLVIRLWLLAGDADRAMRIARTSGAFADAVMRLERTHAEAGAKLRVLWAEHLAEAGDYARAVDVIWKLSAERRRAIGWMYEAMTLGGIVGARMLLRATLTDHEHRPELMRRCIALLEDEALETREARTALVLGVAAEPTSETTSLLARPAVRTVLRDAAAWGRGIERGHLERLVERSADATLRADLPPRPAEKPRVDLGDPEHPSTFTIRVEDSGLFAIHDVVRLPDGRVLVALGEAGVRLLTRDGRPAVHFDVPARHLVPSDHGRHVITLIERGPIASIGRVDLVYTRATPWCELPLTAWARDFDGASWFVATRSPGAREDTLIELDAARVRVESLWQVQLAHVVAIARTSTPAGASLHAVTATGPRAHERWTWSTPGPTLRSRTPLDPEPPGRRFVLSTTAIAADGTVLSIGADVRRSIPLDDDALERSFTVELDGGPGELVARFRSDQSTHLTLRSDGRARDIRLDEGAIGFAPPQLVGDWIAAPIIRGGDAAVLVLDAQTYRVVARLELEGARHVAARLGTTHLVAADDRGRIVSFDHTIGRITSSLRL